MFVVTRYGNNDIWLIGAKTVPRNHANKNTPNKNSDFMLIFAIESIENTIKTLLKYREGGRTVGSGRVASIIE